MRRFEARKILMAAILALLTGAAAQLAVPLSDTPVPVSFSVVAVYLTGVLLEKQYALVSQAAYVLLGAAGAPFFFGFTGGLHQIEGPVGGYILSFPLMAVMVAALSQRWGRGFWKYCAYMLAALAVCYTLGTLQLLAVTQADLQNGLKMAVFPFIAADLAKIVLTAGVCAFLPGASGREKRIKAAFAKRH